MATSGCEPAATICVELNCEIDGTTAATCTGTTAAPAMMLGEGDQLSSLVDAPLPSNDMSTLTSLTTITETTEIPAESMPWKDVTILTALWEIEATNYTAPETSTTSSRRGSSQTAASTSGEEVASGTSEGAQAATITGESGASHMMLGFSGVLAGVLSVAMAYL